MTNLGKSLLVVPLIVLAMPFVWIWNLIKKGLNRITEFCGKDQP